MFNKSNLPFRLNNQIKMPSKIAKRITQNSSYYNCMMHMKFKIDIWMLSLKTLRTYGNKNDKKTKNWLEKRTFLFQSIPEVKWPKRNIVKQSTLNYFTCLGLLPPYSYKTFFRPFLFYEGWTHPPLIGTQYSGDFRWHSVQGRLRKNHAISYALLTSSY